MMIFIWWYFLSHPCQASSNAHKRGSIGHRAPFLILVKIEKKEIAFFLHKGIINIISMYICITFCTQIGFELKVYNICFMWKGNLLYTDITFEIENVSSLQTDLSPPSRPWPSPARRWAEREGAISPQPLRSPLSKEVVIIFYFHYLYQKGIIGLNEISPQPLRSPLSQNCVIRAPLILLRS